MDDTEPTDAVLDALWRRALDAWDDPKVHVALLEHASRSEGLPTLAGRYRALSEDPERGPKAKERLAAIVVAATAMLEATKAPPPGKVPLPITLTAFAIAAVMLTWLGWAMWGSR